MAYKIYRKKNTLTAEEQKALTAVSATLVAAFIIALAVFLKLIPAACFLVDLGLCFMLIFFSRKKAAIFNRELLLQIQDDSIDYYSQERGGIISVNPSEIARVTTRFCELVLYMRDDSVHRIEMSDFSTEQSRWEVKELIKRMIKAVDRQEEVRRAS